MTEGKELVPVVDDASTYLAIQHDPAQLAETIEANLGGEQLSAFDLSAIKIPTAGGTSWIVPDLEGDKLQKTISGVIVVNRLTRSMWVADEPDNSPPDCSSPDAKFPTPGGKPGDELLATGKGCADCPLSQWGSKDDDDDEENGQKCKLTRQLFLLDPEEMLPFVVSIPAGSLKNAKAFLQQLSSKALPYWAVVVEIGLEGATSAGGVAYSKATFKVVKRLDPPTTAKVKAYADALAPVIAEQRTYEQPAGVVFDADVDDDGTA
jgi:hypothetical protein